MSITARIGELLVNITANAGGFLKPMFASRKELSQFQKAVSATRGTMSAFNQTLALVGGGISFGAAIASARSYMQELDSLGKASAKLGVDTKELSALRFGGEQSGLGDGVVAKSLQKLSQRISEAKQGAGEALPIFKELGLSVNSLSGMTADKQLNVIADAMQGVTNQGDKIRIMTKLFEEEGVGLLNMLSNGSQGLNEFRNEARKMGIDFGTEAVAGIEKANDAINRLKTTMGAIGQKIVIEMAPEVERTANKLAIALQEYRAGSDLRGQAGGGSRIMSALNWIGNRQLKRSLFANLANVQKETERLVLRDMARGIAMQSNEPRAKDVRDKVAWPGTRDEWWQPMSQAAIDKQNAERIRNESLSKGLSFWLDRGSDTFGNAKAWMQGDGAKTLGTAAKAIEDTQKAVRDMLRGAALESLIRPPGWKAERERNAEARKEREDRIADRRKELEDRINGQGPAGLNSAIEANTAEAFRVIAENKIAKAQLEVAREAKKLLENIDRGIGKIQLEGVGL